MRYVATIEIYVHGDTPKEAMKEALSICETMGGEQDCQAQVTEFHRTPFATLVSDKLDAHALKMEIMNEEFDNQ